MIKSITATNYLGESLLLDLTRPEKSGFVVLSLSGLGPGEATINTSEFSTMDGGSYSSARIPVRNIVLSLKYLWKDSIEESRHRSYKYFPLKKKVKLVIESDTRFAEIEGYVEANDPYIFAKSEGTTISIICPNPLFYSYGKDVTVFSGIEPMFEFPFSNESLGLSLIEISAIKNKTENVVVYSGESEIGVTITIHAVGEAGDITIYNTRTRETMKLDITKLATLTGSGIVFGDDIVICTVKGKKSVTLVREGETTNILNCLDKNSDWFQLARGDNVFAYTAVSGATNLQFKVENQIAYEGV